MVNIQATREAIEDLKAGNELDRMRGRWCEEWIEEIERLRRALEQIIRLCGAEPTGDGKLAVYIAAHALEEKHG